MATPNVRDILRVPGRLCVNPTDLSLPYPHGGTGLGVVHRVVARPEQRYSLITAEEFGEVVESVQTTNGISMAGVVRSWDNDLYAKLFPNTGTGAVTQKLFVQGISGVRVGSVVSDRSTKLFFSPDDADHNPGLLVYRALPMIQETMELNLTLEEDFGLGFVFVGIRDASNRLWQAGFRSDLSL